MTSKFDGFLKLFIKISLRNDETLTNILSSHQSILLKGNKAFHEPHITVMVLHIKMNTKHTEYFTSQQFCGTINDLYSIEQSPLLEIKTSFKIIGSHPECFVYSLDNSPDFDDYIYRFKKLIIDHLCRELNLIAEDHSYNSVNSDERSYTDFVSEGEVIFRTSSFNTFNRELCEMTMVRHITIVSSFDLKKHNKVLFKEYNKSQDKSELLSSELSPIPNSLLNIDLTESFISTSMKKDGVFCRY